MSQSSYNKGNIQDFHGQNGPPANPPVLTARAFYDSTADQFRVIDSNGLDIIVAGTGGGVTSVFGSTGAITTLNNGMFTGTTDFANIQTVNLDVTGTLEDGLGSVGSAGQLLSSTGTTIQWVNAPASFVNPMTTAGDIIINNSTPAAARLGIGTTGQVLTVVGGLPAWTTIVSGVTSVFGRTGAVVAVSGDYTVAQVTGAAPLASPALTGTPTSVTGTPGDASTQIATDAFVAAAIAVSGAVIWNHIGSANGNMSIANAGFTTTFNQTSAVLWDWENTTTASAITTNASPLLGVSAQYWTGAASANDQWTIGSVMTAGTNAISTLTIAHTGTTGAAQIQLPTPLSYGVTDPQIIGPAGATCGISIGGNASFPLLVATIAGSVDIMRGYQGGTNQGSITSQSTSVSFGLYNQLALGTAEIGSAQSPSATYTGGKPLVSLGHGGSTWATTGAGPYIGINVGAEVSLGGNNSVHLNWAPTAGAGTFTAMQIAPTINQTLTASGSYTALKVAVTETALLGTANFMINCFAGAAGTTQVWAVDNLGAMYMAKAAAAAPTSAASPGTIGQLIMFGGNLYMCSQTGSAGSALWWIMNRTAV